MHSRHGGGKRARGGRVQPPTRASAAMPHASRHRARRCARVALDGAAPRGERWRCGRRRRLIRRGDAAERAAHGETRSAAPRRRRPQHPSGEAVRKSRAHRWRQCGARARTRRRVAPSAGARSRAAARHWLQRRATVHDGSVPRCNAGGAPRASSRGSRARQARHAPALTSWTRTVARLSAATSPAGARARPRALARKRSTWAFCGRAAPAVRCVARRPVRVASAPRPMPAVSGAAAREQR